MKKFLKILFTVILVLFVIIFILAIIASAYLKSKLNKIQYENVTKDDIEVNEGIEEKLEKYTNIALLGLDSRDNTFANSRSDCIMIISINNETSEVKIASIYRDTYLQIKNHGLDKVTHAYAYDRAPLALSTINTNLDLNITKYVTINFNSVIKIIDAMNGVTITVTNAEAKRIPGLNGVGGTYNLNGTQALAYGRIRKIDSDYVRTERMRNVLIKAFEKAKTLSYTNLNTLIDKLLPEVATNVSQKEILSYATKINKYNVVENFGWPYKVRGYSAKAWYAVPVTLESNVKELHQTLFADEIYEPSQTVKEISQKIISKTDYTK